MDNESEVLHRLKWCKGHNAAPSDETVVMAIDHIQRLEAEKARLEETVNLLDEAINFYMANGGIYPDGFDHVQKLIDKAELLKEKE